MPLPCVRQGGMARNAMMDDLFGHVPQRQELPLAETNDTPESRPFGRTGDPRSENPLDWYPLPPPGGHTADTIRPMALRVLEEARELTTMTWSPHKLRSHTWAMPTMCEWLKNGEGDALLAQFKAEMDRLNAPVDQMAPNWKRIWGLPT